MDNINHQRYQIASIDEMIKQQKKTTLKLLKKTQYSSDKHAKIMYNATLQALSDLGVIIDD